MTKAIEAFQIVPGLLIGDIATVKDGQNAMALLTNRLRVAAMDEAKARDNAKEYIFLSNVDWQRIKQENSAAKTAYGFLRDRIRVLNDAERKHRLDAQEAAVEAKRLRKEQHRDVFRTWDRRVLTVVKELFPEQLEDASSVAQERFPDDFKATIL